MFIVHFHENISAHTNTLTFSINYAEAIDSKSINTLTTNIPHHIETRQLVCTANQLTGFYMGTLIVNGVKEVEKLFRDIFKDEYKNISPFSDKHEKSVSEILR